MIAAGLAVAAFAWMYARIVSGLVAEWVSSPDASYGLVLTCVAIALVWRRRHAFVDAIDPSGEVARPIAAMLSSLGLFVAGQLGADLFLTRLSLVAVLVSALWLLAGSRAVRTLAAPLAFLLIAVPLPAILVNAITLPLQLVASRIAESTLAFAGVPVFRDGNMLTLPSTTLEVAEACSGLRSLVSLVAIAGLLAWSTPGRVGWRVALVVAAVPIAIVMNGLRIAATGLACEAFGTRAAANPWHELEGWITFVASVALLAVCERVFERSAKTSRSVKPMERGNPMEREASAERHVLA